MSFSVNASGKPQAVKDQIIKQVAAALDTNLHANEALAIATAELALVQQLDFLIRVAPDKVVWAQAVGSCWERSTPATEDTAESIDGSCSLTIEVRGA